MQCGTEYLFRDHRFTSPQFIKYPALGKGVGVRGIRDCNGWNNFATSPCSNTVRADKWNFYRFPLVPFAVLLLPGTRKLDLLFRCIFPFFPNFQFYSVICTQVGRHKWCHSLWFQEQVTSYCVFTALNVHLGKPPGVDRGSVSSFSRR